MSIKKYIQQNLPNVIFEAPFFYNADVAIRFELGSQDSSIDDHTYFSSVKERAVTLFEAIFSEHNPLYIMVYTYESIEPLNAYIGDSVEVFSHFLSSQLSGQVEEFVKTELLDEDTNELTGYLVGRAIHCNLSDFDHRALLGALGGFSETHDNVIDAVYFIDPTQNIIFHIYDSRGLDVVSPDKESISFLYHDYNNWILNYDRERIDHIFID